jgi:hypothetical protein
LSRGPGEASRRPGDALRGRRRNITVIIYHEVAHGSTIPPWVARFRFADVGKVAISTSILLFAERRR